MDPRATIDFEGRSACDLIRRGAWLYSKHPSTQLHCLGYHLPGSREVKLWHRAYPELGIPESSRPDDLFEYIEEGGLVEAHNALFEFFVWNNVGVRQHRWPKIKLKQLCCSAAKAAAHALPRSLDGACEALNLPVRKDPRGKYLINKYCKPKKLIKGEVELWGKDAIIFNEDVDGIAELWAYNKQDIRAEVRLSESIPDLSPMEREIWLITQRMNIRGVQIDTDLARSALELVREAKAKANSELFELTGIESASQRAALKAWLSDYELTDLPDSKAKTLEHLLERDGANMTPRARRVIEIIREVNRTSTDKYKRMLECVDVDDRARELMVYCGAERTGRFSSSKIQIHNLPKGKFTAPLSKEDKKRAMDIACEDVKSRDLAWCEAIHGDVMNLLASCLRGAIVAPPGRELLTADYAAIEARCVLWEAGADAALEVFRTGGDIYCDMASGIYGYPIVKDEKGLLKNPDAKIAAVINSTGATQRDFGKVAVLGLGYGMGYIKFLITLRTYNIRLTRLEVLKMMGTARLQKYERVVRKKLFPRPEDFLTNDEPERAFRAAARDAALNRRRLEEEYEEPLKILHELALCKYTVETYRKRYPQVPAMWKAQEAAAIQAVQTSKAVRCGKVIWQVKGRFLKCRLPSGRCLNYCDPQLAMAKTSWGEKRPSLRFKGIHQKSKQWVRQATYGGKITENITQAIARDVMATAQMSIDKDPIYDMIITVHDQFVTEVDEGCGDKRAFEALVSALPAAYDGCPITAEAERYKRFRK